MNNIDEMPPRCHDCPYWEICEEPYVCPVDVQATDMNNEWRNETVYKKDIVGWIDSILAHEDKLWENEKSALVMVKYHIIDMTSTTPEPTDVRGYHE